MRHIRLGLLFGIVAVLTGRVASATPEVVGMDVRSFGAVGDGKTDDTNAIQRAIDSRPNGGVAIYFPATGARYRVTKTLHISHSRINLFGDGQQATVVEFAPVKPATLFSFDRGKESIWQCSIRHLAISGDSPVAKTAIEAVDVRIFTIEDVAIYPWKGNGNAVGLHIAGREFVRVVQTAIVADRPLVISPNANSWISLDQSHFEDVSLTATGRMPVITVESGATLTNVIFDGAQSWVGGNFGLYWADRETKTVSANVSINNVRREQGLPDPNAWVIYISHHAGLQNLIIHNLYGDLGSNGIFLSNCWWGSVDHFVYPGHLQAFNAAQTANHHIAIRDSFFQNGSSIESTSFGRSGRNADNWVDSPGK